MNTSLDDAGRCLLSVAWNIRTGVPRAGARKEEIRARLQSVCRSMGHAACARAAAGWPPDHVPFLKLADLAYEIDTLLLLVDTALAPDADRDRRRWAEIETLVAGVDDLVDQAAAILGGQLAVSR
ncbi:hypothetical protein ACQPXB_17205 [Amycolatopsis sp. CA-161197]|uniref:hypothetical protein n=1 Tax=Amycolatopsis sp. CA-161197 TaxID=3239922 RepID=UPI003D8D1982